MKKSRRFSGSITRPWKLQIFTSRFSRTRNIKDIALSRRRTWARRLRHGRKFSNRRAELHGPECWSAFQIHRSDLILDRLRNPRISRLFLEQTDCRRRARVAMRLAQRQIRLVLAGHPHDLGGIARRQRSQESATRHASHAENEKNRDTGVKERSARKGGNAATKTQTVKTKDANSKKTKRPTRWFKAPPVKR